MASTPSGLFVRDLYLYPLKSAAGIRLETAALDTFGIAGDRRWMLIDAGGRFLSQREQSRMALLRVSLPGAGGLAIDAPGMPTLAVDTPAAEAGAARLPVTVWDDACEALDAGDEAARWATAFLGEPCRLVYAPDDMVRPVDRTYASGDERVGFSDGFPLLLIGQGSLDDVNARLVAKGEAAVPMNRFRPNVVIEGGAPFAEDGWRRLAIGTGVDGGADQSAAPAASDAANVILLDIVKPCARCSIIPVDQATGVRGKEPLATLATYRKRDGKVFFGQNVLHRGLGVLRAGAPVTLVS